MATAADLSTATDALTARVAQTQTEIAALKASIVPPDAPLITQGELDAAVAAVTDATTKLGES